MDQRRGRFITSEGTDGSGKTTQIRLLSDYLKAYHIPHTLTREPGGTPHAERLRSLLLKGSAHRWQPLTEALLMSATRQEHVTHLIHPTLAAGTWVLCDRFADSTLAYQGYGHELGAKKFKSSTPGLWKNFSQI